MILMPTSGYSEELPLAHTFSNPTAARVTHTHLNLTIDFNQRILLGSATLEIERISGQELRLDTLDLEIQEIRGDVTSWKKTPSEKSSLAGYGQPLVIQLAANNANKARSKIEIDYQTSPSAPALQWMRPEQTSSKNPFMFAMNFPIGARSWFPCQDTPVVRGTYSADLKIVADHATQPLMAVASSKESPHSANQAMTYRNIRSDQAPIPSYLFVIAAGELHFQQVSNTIGFYTNDSESLKTAVSAFGKKVPIYYDHLKNMLGADPWGYHNFLFLPPMFAYGGMENPQLIFINAALIEKTGASAYVLAHELAHQWTGNQVTNAGWEDFWINEGWTSKFEELALARMDGKPFALGNSFERYQELLIAGEKLKAYQKGVSDGTVKPHAINSQLTQLGKTEIQSVHPEEFIDYSVYSKGTTLLSAIESLIGEESFLKYARAYVTKFSLQSIQSKAFISFSKEYLSKVKPNFDWEEFLNEWIFKPGVIPTGLPQNLARLGVPYVQGAQETLTEFKTTGPKTDFSKWNRFQIVNLLVYLKNELSTHPEPTRKMIPELGKNQSFMDKVMPFVDLKSPWYVILVKSGEWKTHKDEIRNFLVSLGRARAIHPIYEELANSKGVDPQAGIAFAKEIYLSKNESGTSVRSRYFPYVRNILDQVLGVSAEHP